VYAKVGVSFSFVTSSGGGRRGGYVHERAGVEGGKLFAVDVGARQTAEERELEAVKSLGYAQVSV
jgi:hypothetical protein